jgi:hypothetical protein
VIDDAMHRPRCGWCVRRGRPDAFDAIVHVAGLAELAAPLLRARGHPLRCHMLYMLVEHFRDGDPRPVYARARERGRLLPNGLRYVTSWVSEDLRRCWQVMDCEDAALLHAWIARWSDLVDFEVHPVVTSAEAAAAVAALP